MRVREMMPLEHFEHAKKTGEVIAPKEYPEKKED